MKRQQVVGWSIGFDLNSTGCKGKARVGFSWRVKHRFAYTPPDARQSKDGYSWRVEHRFDLCSTRSQRLAGFFILHIPVRATPSTAALTRASVVGLVLPASLCMLAIAARLMSIVDAAYRCDSQATHRSMLSTGTGRGMRAAVVDQPRFSQNSANTRHQCK